MAKLEDLKKEAMALGIDEKDIKDLKGTELKELIDKRKKLDDLKARVEKLGVDTKGKDISELAIAISDRLEEINKEQSEKLKKDKEPEGKKYLVKGVKPFYFNGEKVRIGEKLEITDKKAYEELKEKALILEY